ncbi:MAG: cytochrome c biogenesis protein CcsA [Acidobacteria bacterium]|nr:cytochrome c biogenesis protein CcsA [Acidobacteriota bacterium]
MSFLGNASLFAAAACLLCGAVCAALSRRRGAGPWAHRAAAFVHAATAAVFTASAVLAVVLVRGDFTFRYVADHTSRSLPVVYRLTAFWAGAEGSLLLWLLLMAACSSVSLRAARKTDGGGLGRYLLAMSLTEFLFALLALRVSNPFGTLAVPPPDGAGMNPLLQNPAMIWHPPLLILGYAAFAVPFALALSALADPEGPGDWTRRARAWTLFAWAALTAGIVLGAQWAYVELGWGGYWGWDPVENASLIPWLGATAFVHLSALHRRRGAFPRLVPFLAVTTFLLCIFGTWLTRSGALDSVHAFQRSGVGGWLLAFMGVALAVTLVLLAAGRRKGRPAGAWKPGPGDAAVTLSAGFLIAFLIVVAYGTVHGILPGWMQSGPGAPGDVPARVSTADGTGPSPSTNLVSALPPRFFNRAVVPLGIALVALLGIHQVLRRPRDPLGKLVAFAALLLPAAAVAGALVNLLDGNVPAAVLFALCAAALPAVVAGTLRGGPTRPRLAAALCHLGFVVVAAGIGASGWFARESRVVARPGETFTDGEFRLIFNRLVVEDPDAEKAVYRAEFSLVPPRAGAPPDFAPEVRFYRRTGGTGMEVDVRTGFVRDLYLAFFPMNPERGEVAVQLRVIPGMSWIWFGAALAVIGALLAVPRPRRGEDDDGRGP